MFMYEFYFITLYLLQAIDRTFPSPTETFVLFSAKKNLLNLG